MPRLASLTNSGLTSRGITSSVSAAGGLTGVKDLVSGTTVLSASLPSGMTLSNSQTKNSVSYSMAFSGTQTSTLKFTNAGFGTYPVTIEYWAYITSTNTVAPLALNNTTTTQSAILQSSATAGGSGSGYFPLVSNTTTGSTTSYGGGAINTLATNTWHHFAFTVNVSGTTITPYLNGVPGVALTPPGGSYTLQNTNAIALGGWPYTSILLPMIGYISEVRVSNNIRYTTTFTPPSGYFTIDGTTTSLIRSYT